MEIIKDLIPKLKQRRVRAITLQRAIEQPMLFHYILNYLSLQLGSHCIIQKYGLCDNTFQYGVV